MHNTTIVVYKCALDLRPRDYSTTFHFLGTSVIINKNNQTGGPMSKPNTKDQILSIEEQIKRLKEKQKRILSNSQKEIGKYVMDTWEVEDVTEAKELIDSFKDKVQSLSEASSSSEDAENTQEEETPVHQPKES